MKGKALEKFEEWYFEKYGLGFHQLPLVCQQALWVEWFDSVGIYIDPFHSYAFDQTLEFCVKVNGTHVNHGISDKPINRFDTRPEALSKAIEKATEILNQKKL